MPLCWVFTKVHLKHWGHLAVPQYYTAAAKLERAQGRATMVFRGWRTCCMKRREWTWPYLAGRRQLWRREHLPADCLYIPEGYRGKLSQTCPRSAKWKDKRHWAQAATQETLTRHQNRKFFTARPVRHRSRVTRKVVLSPSVEIFGTWLKKTLSHLILVWCQSCSEQKGEMDDFQISLPTLIILSFHNY